MVKKLGIVLFYGGMASLIYTGINYINGTENFGFLGIEILVSKGNSEPVIMSAVVMIIGFVIATKVSR